MGEYISALSNSAAITGRKNAYFVWGINDESHEITGTNFNCIQNINNEPLKHYLARKFSPDISFTFEDIIMEGKRMVLLTIPAAKLVPTSYAKERYIRIGSSKENLRKYPEKEAFLFDVLRHGFPTIENTSSDYQDLTFEKLLIYYGAKGLKLNLDTFNSSLKRGSEFSDDISAYDLILKNKERLLSFSEPTRFIFSHSALREGWDSPNVFQICTLKHSDSQTAKRQEWAGGCACA